MRRGIGRATSQPNCFRSMACCRAAFAAACRLHPDLAAAAVDPMGSPVIPGSPVAVPMAQPAAIRPRDFGWGRIIEQLNGAAVENAPGAGPAREHAGGSQALAADYQLDRGAIVTFPEWIRGRFTALINVQQLIVFSGPSGERNVTRSPRLLAAAGWPRPRPRRRRLRINLGAARREQLPAPKFQNFGG